MSTASASISPRCWGARRQGSTRNGGFFDAIRQDPVLNRVKLIAEPWDIGPGGYQLGAYPHPFLEWNDRYRDGVRRFWRGDAGMTPDLANRLLGSAERFDHSGRAATSSVNFLTAHDGFTLEDLVSYTVKRNLANGEDNRDGTWRQPLRQSRGRGADRRSGDPRRARPAQAQPAGHAVAVARARRCCWRATSLATARAATTMPMPRTTRPAGSTGTDADTELTAFVARLTDAAAHPSGRAAAALPACAAAAGGWPARRDLAPRRWRRAARRRLARSCVPLPWRGIAGRGGRGSCRHGCAVHRLQRRSGPRRRPATHGAGLAADPRHHATRMRARAGARPLLRCLPIPCWCSKQ